MTGEWEILKRDCSNWIEPAALEALMSAITPGKVDNRTLLLELAHRYGRGERLGRALRTMNDYRTPDRVFHPMSSVVIIGAVRFMFEAGRGGDQPEIVEAKLRHHLNPAVTAFTASWRADQTMGFFAFARTASELRAEQRSHERSAEYVRRFVQTQATKTRFESPDDTSVAEARSWLRGRRRAFAINRFPRLKEARAFVDALYAAGAPRVVIENIVKGDDGQASADSMVVHLPPEPTQRVAVLRIISEVGRPDTDGKGIADPGTNHIGLWWD